MTMSAALRWPVSSPWKLDRHGRPTAYLSSQQRAVLLYLAGSRKRGRRTLEEMARTLGMTSRGQLSRELRRLRQLDLIGYRTRLGARGWHQLWLNRKAARLRALRAQRRDNDSLSTPAGFISRSGVEKAWLSGRRPPSRAGAAARDGPRRGLDPPRVLYARCPAGHQARLPRGPWTRVRDGMLRAEWSGVCRRCGDRPIREVVELALAPAPPRPLSPEELADPEVLERRRRLALEAFADPSTPLELRERIRRDYLDDRSESSSSSAGPPAAGPLAGDVDRIVRRRPPSESPPGAGGQS